MSAGDKLVFDIETDDLLQKVTKIHLICTFDIEDGSVKIYHDEPWNFKGRCGSVEEGLHALEEAKLTAGHNICQYDIPVMEKLTGFQSKDQVRIDTLALSRLLYPDRFTHDLGSWAKKLRTKVHKVQNEDWTELSQNMIDRCVADILINEKLLTYFQVTTNEHLEKNTNWLDALFLEQEVQAIHAEQTLTGVKYFVEQAKATMANFDGRMNVLKKIIMDGAPPVLDVPGVTKVKIQELREGLSDDFVKGTTPFKKDGSTTAVVDRWFNEEDTVYGTEYRMRDTVAGRFCKVEFLPMNVNSDTQIKKFLKQLGWVPDEWNTKKQPNGTYLKTSPKLTETSYGSLPEGLGKTVVDYRCLKHRRGLIQSLKDDTKGALAKVRPDGRVSAEAITCGTPTARYRHSGAVCNIPRPSSPWGKEIRELYGVEPGWWMVGIDLSGIEARMLAHFCAMFDGGNAFAELILTKKDGGWHSANAELWNCTRDQAKEFLYALMYGAGPTKLGNILGRDVKVGKRNRDAFMNAYTPYAELLIALEENITRNGGYLVGLDGRRFYIRNKKDALNTLLQGNSAIIFKKWMVDLARIRKEATAPIKQMIAYHDETQNEVQSEHRSIAEKFGEDACTAAYSIGKQFKLRVDLAADYSIGRNWSDTH